MWDYSESAIKKFRETSNEEYPRGVGWTDMFGHQANARWMYNFHEAVANSVKLVKECLRNESVDSLPVFRYITRMNVFNVMNDFDGSGLELLSKELDILHIDPYPVSDKGYDEKVIPRDMTYLEGFARRYNKPIVSWMQAHVYGNLKHPTPENISRMMEQQKQFNINSVMWLGYGYNNSGNTFPQNEEAWETVSIEHSKFKNQLLQKKNADFALIRPYTARTVYAEKQNTADRFLTDYILESALFDYHLCYDPFEPLSCETLETNELKKYPLVIAEIGILNEKTLKPFVLSEVTTILTIAGAEFDKGSFEMLSIKRILDNHQDRKLINEYSKIELKNNTEIIYQINGNPIAWRNGNIIFISRLPENNLNGLAVLLLGKIFEK